MNLKITTSSSSRSFSQSFSFLKTKRLSLMQRTNSNNSTEESFVKIVFRETGISSFDDRSFALRLKRRDVVTGQSSAS